MKLLRVSMLGALVLLVTGSLAHGAEGAWGTVKGQVVWAGEKDPTPVKLNLGNNPDKATCLAKGPLMDPSITVDPKTKGVRWVMVWIGDKAKPLDPKAAIPIHPDLKALKDKEIVVDQPCCLYEPFVFGIRVGQTVVAKNSSKITHNVNVISPNNGPNVNLTIPPGQQVKIEGFQPTTVGSVLFSCSIHGWMKASARVFNHPYFTVTNAEGEFELKNVPAGTFRLVVWHPEYGWITSDRKGEEIMKGKEITIKAGETTDVKKIEVKEKPKS